MSAADHIMKMLEFADLLTDEYQTFTITVVAKQDGLSEIRVWDKGLIHEKQAAEARLAEAERILELAHLGLERRLPVVKRIERFLAGGEEE